MLRIIVLFAAFAFSSSSFAGGGWAQPKGKGYFKLSEWWVSADKHYTLDGMTDPNVTAGLYNTTFYGEYGFTNKLTGIINAPLLSRAVINNLVSITTNEIISKGDAINVPGDIDLILKYGFFQNTIVSLAASLQVSIPIGEKAGGRGMNLQTGDGEFNQIVRVDAGFPLGNSDSFSTYGNIYGAFNKRNKGFSDEVRYGVELGIGILSQKLWLIGRYDALKSRNNKPSGPIEGSFFANNSEVTSITAEVSYLITDKFGVSASYGTAISGKIIYAAPSYSFGVFLKV
ncbi:MAG: transporter [Saprospiraceae bacterium]